MWRQGDVLIERVEAIPDGLKQTKRLILASGDSTAHRHRIKERGTAKLFDGPRGDMYLHVTVGKATVDHPEHGAIELAPGCYRVWMQREFDERGERRVRD